MTLQRAMGAAAFVLVFGLVDGGSALAEETLASVTGQVMLDGKPLVGGRVFFFLGDGQFVGSKVKDGAFKVSRVPVGVCRVAIEGKGVPAAFASDETTSLTADIVSGANTFDFSLKGRR